MTSSFGTVVGTPRDDLPDISDTNYQATSANLSTSLNKEIDRVTDDARAQSQYLQRILEAQKSPADRLKQLADFAKTAVEFSDVLEKTRQARELNANAVEELDQAQAALQKRKENNLLNIEAQSDGDLLREKDPIATDLFLASSEVDEGEKGNLRKIGREYLPKIFAGAGNWRTDNGFDGTLTKLEGINIYDQSEELLGVSILYQYEQAGVNINSAAFRKEWTTKIYPEIIKEKDKAILNLETRLRYNQEKILTKKTANDITLGIEGSKDKTVNGVLVEGVPYDTRDTIDRIKKRYTINDKEALLHFFKTVQDSVKNKDGKFSADDLEYLENEALFFDKSQNKLVVFDDLKIGDGSEIENIKVDNADALREARPNIDDLKKAQYDNFITKHFQPEYKEAIENNGGTFTQDQSLKLRTAWETGGGDPAAFPVELLNTESRNYTGNAFGEQQFGRSTSTTQPGVVQDPLILRGIKNLETRYLAELNKDKQPGDTKVTLNNMSIEQFDVLEKAKGELIESLREEKGVTGEFNARTVKERVDQEIINILDGNYSIEDRGLQNARIENFEAYGNKVKDDESILDGKEFIGVYEKAGLADGLDALLNNRRLPQYWINVAKQTGDDPTALLIRRLIATGGYNEETRQLLLDKTHYKLTKEERELIDRNPSINKSIALFYSKKTKNQVGDLMDSVRPIIMVDGKPQKVGDGHYLQDNGQRVFTRNNANSMSMNKLINGKGIYQIGRYGFSQQDLKDIKAYASSKKPPLLDFDADFDENAQTQALAILWKLRVEAKNGTRGFEIDDAQTGAHKMPNFSEQDIELLNEIFPKLKDADFFDHWASHSDDLNNMFLSDKEVAQEAQATAYNERIGDDLVSAFINENRDTKGFKATVDGKEVKFRKDDGSLIQDIKFSDLNEAAQKALLNDQGLRFNPRTDEIEVKPKKAKGRRTR
tara:strand:- start:4637 stop:7465 length:2829 start_codon:yes stop_codon:yes gene_type:complete